LGGRCWPGQAGGPQARGCSRWRGLTILVCREDGALQAGPSLVACVCPRGLAFSPRSLCWRILWHLLWRWAFSLPWWMVGLSPRLAGRTGGLDFPGRVGLDFIFQEAQRFLPPPWRWLRPRLPPLGLHSLLSCVPSRRPSEQSGGLSWAARQLLGRGAKGRACGLPCARQGRRLETQGTQE